MNKKAQNILLLIASKVFLVTVIAIPLILFSSCSGGLIGKSSYDTGSNNSAQNTNAGSSAEDSEGGSRASSRNRGSRSSSDADDSSDSDSTESGNTGSTAGNGRQDNSEEDGGNTENDFKPEEPEESSHEDSEGGEEAGTEEGGHEEHLEGRGEGGSQCECSAEYLDEDLYIEECEAVLCAVANKASSCGGLGSTRDSEDIADALSDCGVFEAIGSSCVQGEGESLEESIASGSIESDASSMPEKMNEFMCEKVKSECETCEHCEDPEENEDACRKECNQCMQDLFSECEGESCSA